MTYLERTMQPTADRILLEVIKEESVQGIILPELAMRKAGEPFVGVAVAIGPECEFVQVGDMVLFLGGVQVWNRKDHLALIKEFDIIAVHGE